MDVKETVFTAKDIIQINEHKLSLDLVENHLNIFRKGISKIILERPATIGDGILYLNFEDFEKLAAEFDEKKDTRKLLKFVPASGAASRMFKFLNEFLNEFDVDNETINAYINRKKNKNLRIFITGMDKFPFYKTIDDRLKTLFPDYDSWDSDAKVYQFVKFLLDSDGLDYANKPKGVLPFHSYDEQILTPVEEHLKECIHYASSGIESHLHFTVSESHQQMFESIVDNAINKLKAASGTNIKVDYSFQDPSTDTIAVDMENHPLRDVNGKLVFRPGGHGALINNLNRLDSDVIFIKNIDNVIQNHTETTALYKKGLAALLLQIQEKVFGLLQKIEKEVMSEDDIEDVITFMKKELNAETPEDFNKYTSENKIEFIREKLNRPIRICGMVKNEGEPGGGPFWVKDLKGNLSLQIVESSQVDHEISEQLAILNSSTHFNPVDIVCSTKDFKGNKFDLNHYIDHTAGFIVEKNNKGTALKAYELPGLWNGAMANWITVFVEVPLITFNPVKTVNDLLKPAHQPQ